MKLLLSDDGPMKTLFMLGVIQRIQRKFSNSLRDLAGDASIFAVLFPFVRQVSRKTLCSLIFSSASKKKDCMSLPEYTRSCRNAFLSPLSLEKSEIASNIFVLPAPFSPKKTTNCEENLRSSKR